MYSWLLNCPFGKLLKWQICYTYFNHSKKVTFLNFLKRQPNTYIGPFPPCSLGSFQIATFQFLVPRTPHILFPLPEKFFHLLNLPLPSHCCFRLLPDPFTNSLRLYLKQYPKTKGRVRRVPDKTLYQDEVLDIHLKCSPLALVHLALPPIFPSPQSSREKTLS